MSTDNRVESNVAALVARRSFRSSIDRSGMGFQEELLSLSFESTIQIPETGTDLKSSSVEQSSDRSEETIESEEDSKERREREGSEYGFPFPLPQLPVSNTASTTQESDSVLGSTEGTELVKGVRTTDKVEGTLDGNPSENRKQPTSIVRDGVSDQRDSSNKDVENANDSGKVELIDGNWVDNPTDGRSETQPEQVAPTNTESPIIREQSESKDALKRSESKGERLVSEGVIPPVEAAVETRDRSRSDDEIAVIQEALTSEQGDAPNRSRRNSRQDRLREEDRSDSRRVNTDALDGKERDLEGVNALEAAYQDADPTVNSGQLDIGAMQSTGSVPAESNYSFAGQMTANPTEGAVWGGPTGSGATNAAAASSTLTPGVLGSADKIVLGDGSPVSPVAAGVPKGETAASGGRGTGRAEGATGTSTLSSFQQSKLVQRVLKGLEQLSSGGGQVRLRLHPPELGTLQMTLKIEANVMSAHLEVENSLAKDALLNNLQSLRDRLSEQGMLIDRFEVEVRTDSQSGTGSAFGDAESNQQSRREQPESRYAIYNENRLPTENADDSKPSMPWFRTTGKLDLSV